MQTINCATCGTKVQVSAATAYAAIRDHLSKCGKGETVTGSSSAYPNIGTPSRSPPQNFFQKKFCVACDSAGRGCRGCVRACGFAIDEDRGN